MASPWQVGPGFTGLARVPQEARFVSTKPVRVVEFQNHRGVQKADALTLVSKAEDWWTAWQQFYF